MSDKTSNIFEEILSPVVLDYFYESNRLGLNNQISLQAKGFLISYISLNEQPYDLNEIHGLVTNCIEKISKTKLSKLILELLSHGYCKSIYIDMKQKYVFSPIRFSTYKEME